MLNDAEVILVSLVEQNLLDEQIKLKMLRVNPEFWLTFVGITVA